MPKANRSSKAKPTNPRPRRRRSAVNPLDELVQELTLAVRLDRPALLFAISTSPTGIEAAARKLAAGLNAAGYAVQVLTPQVPARDIPLAIRNDRNRTDKVYLVHDLQKGGESALRALNIRREYFTELRVRAVFLLSPQEEAAVAHRAPDFWAFRTRTVELDYSALP